MGKKQNPSGKDGFDKELFVNDFKRQYVALSEIPAKTRVAPDL